MTTVAWIALYHVGTSTPALFYPSLTPGMLQTKTHLSLIETLLKDGVKGYSVGQRQFAREQMPES